jgi:hypothetical protein
MLTESTPLAIEMWPLKKVLPYAGNAKEHPEIQIDQIAHSIKQFGFVNPVLVDATGVCIAGHGRVLAADKLKMKKIPVIQLGYLTEAEAKALRLADNVIPSRGIWNPGLVEIELASLKSLNFDLEPLGLDQIEFPELENEIIPAAPKSQRSKTTIFVSVLNQDVEKARKAIVAALDKIKLPHNL